MVTYVKPYEGTGVSIGGIFGAPVGEHKLALPWSRPQQAAFLIFVWKSVRDALRESKQQPWIRALAGKSRDGGDGRSDLAFAGPHTLLNSDPGVRGILHITNDLCYLLADKLHLEGWVVGQTRAATDEQAVNEALDSLEGQAVGTFLREIATRLAAYDWRASSAEGLSPEERTAKLAFRGSGGYRELRRQLLLHLLNGGSEIGRVAKEVSAILGY